MENYKKFVRKEKEEIEREEKEEKEEFKSDLFRRLSASFDF